jgi:hypothetical protein
VKMRRTHMSGPPHAVMYTVPFSIATYALKQGLAASNGYASQDAAVA